MARNLTRYLSLLWDRAAATRMQQEAEEALAKTGAAAGAEFEEAMQQGGRKAGRALTLALEREYKLRIGRARQQLAEGLIDQRAFEREGREAAEAFNKGLTGGIRRLRTQGNSTDLELANLAGRMKSTTVGGAGGAAAGIGGLLRAGPLAGIFTAGAAIGEANEAISVADEYEASLRKLGGTARQIGVPFEELRARAEAAKDELHLSEPAANELVGTMSKLAARAGDAGRANEALAGWLDLAAAAGLGQEDAMQALNTTLMGQDEGLNRLGLANPKEIYEKWGAGTDEASRAMAILNEVQEAASRVQGEHNARLEDNAGKAELAANKIKDMRAEMGRALQPVRELGQGLRLWLYEILVLISKVAGVVGESIKGWVDQIRWLRGGGGTRAPQPAAVVPAPAPSNVRPRLTAEEARARAEAAEEARKAREEARKDAERAAEAEAKRLQKEAEKVREAALARMGATPSGSLGGDDATTRALREDRARRERERAAFEAAGGTLREMPIADRLIPDVDQVGRFEEAYLGMLENIGDVSDRIAGEIANTFRFTFELMREEGATVGNFLEGVLRGVGAAGLAGLAEYAQGKARENIAAAIQAGAEALGFTSHGNFPSAGAAWASAAQHAAAAVAWGAVVGGAGVAGSAMTTIRGGGGRDAGLDRAERAERMGMEVNLWLNPWDPSNPLMQDSVYAAHQVAAERWGPNTRVTVRTLPGGGGSR